MENVSTCRRTRHHLHTLRLRSSNATQPPRLASIVDLPETVSLPNARSRLWVTNAAMYQCNAYSLASQQHASKITTLDGDPEVEMRPTHVYVTLARRRPRLRHGSHLECAASPTPHLPRVKQAVLHVQQPCRTFCCSSHKAVPHHNAL